MVAEIRDVGDVRDHHELVEARAEGAQRLEQSPATVLVLAAEYLVEYDKTEFRAELAGDPIGDREAQGARGGNAREAGRCTRESGYLIGGDRGSKREHPRPSAEMREIARRCC